MRKRKKSEDSGFNVWRSYSDMMAGVLLLFILIMCVTLFQAQKSYNESIKERDDKIALQEQYTAEILAQQSELDEKNSKLSSQDEQLDKQKKLLAELAAQLKEQQASLDENRDHFGQKKYLPTIKQETRMGLLSQLCLLFIFKHQYFLCFINCFSNIMAHIFICECNPLCSFICILSCFF